MRTCVTPSTDYSHLSWAQAALMVTVCSPPHPASATVAGRGPFELPLEPGPFLSAHFTLVALGPPRELEQGY